MNQTIVNFCPTGMIPTKDMTPHVPISVEEIVEQTHEAWEIGITIAHLHARDEKGVPTYKAEVYSRIVEGVRKHCPGLIVCLSTSGRNFKEFEKRSEVIELYPDMCSLTLSSLNFVQGASVNEPDMIRRLYAKMLEYGVTPELECFDLGMINFGKYLTQDLEGPNYWNLIFGNISGFQADLQQMALAAATIPESDHVAFGGIGKFQLQANSVSIASGHSVRVGLEDNIWLDTDRTKLATNADLIRRVHRLMDENGKTLMPSSDLNYYNRAKASVWLLK